MFQFTGTTSSRSNIQTTHKKMLKSFRQKTEGTAKSSLAYIIVYHKLISMCKIFWGYAQIFSSEFVPAVIERFHYRVVYFLHNFIRLCNNPKKGNLKRNKNSKKYQNRHVIHRMPSHHSMQQVLAAFNIRF